jgi:hypothetical protein
MLLDLLMEIQPICQKLVKLDLYLKVINGKKTKSNYYLPILIEFIFYQLI